MSRSRRCRNVLQCARWTISSSVVAWVFLSCQGTHKRLRRELPHDAGCDRGLSGPQRDPSENPLRFVWLEITSKCNLRCIHCYADSGPQGRSGQVSTERWLSVIKEAAELGVGSVQFIGGEPTIHPDFETLVLAATGNDLGVEVFTNLTHVQERTWSLFREAGVSLATSFYSASSASHVVGARGV